MSALIVLHLVCFGVKYSDQFWKTLAVSFLALVLIAYRRYGYLKTKKIFYCPAFKASIVRQGNGCGVGGVSSELVQSNDDLRAFKDVTQPTLCHGPFWSQKASQKVIIFLLPYLPLTLVCRKMAQLGIIFLFIYMDLQDHAIYCVWIHLFFLPPMLEERRKTIWSVLESNLGPLASQATGLTSRPYLPQASEGVKGISL